jgi:glutathione S-transferase
MAMKLHRCSNTWVKLGGHPCWRAQKALDEAGIDYELVLHSGLRFRRPEVEAKTGQRKVPYIEFEDGTTLLESAEIAARAKDGTLVPPTPPPAAADPPAS